MKTLSLTLAIGLAVLLGVSTSTSWAADCGCAAAADCGCAQGADCGCAQGGCDGCGRGKVCRLVCEEVEVTAECYGTRCADICVPSCGSKCTKTECVKCGTCSCDTTAGRTQVTYPVGKPGCAKVKTVKHLVKYQTTKKVKVWKWHIVDGCGCDAGEE